jgi:hypothetical protein
MDNQNGLRVRLPEPVRRGAWLGNRSRSTEVIMSNFRGQTVRPHVYRRPNGRGDVSAELIRSVRGSP